MSEQDCKFQVGDNTRTGTRPEAQQEVKKLMDCTSEVKQVEVAAEDLTTSTAVGATGDNNVDVVNKSVSTEPEQEPLGTSVYVKSSYKRCTTTINSEFLKVSQNPGNSEDDEDDDNAMIESNGMLYSLESGLLTITKHAKDCMEKCSSGPEKKNMRQSLEGWTLQMLKSEQLLKRLPMLVAEVVDELDSKELEPDSEHVLEEVPEEMFKPMSKENREDMIALVQKLQKALQGKMTEFEDTWSPENLKLLPKFRMLEEQVDESVENPKEILQVVAEEDKGTETESDEDSDEELMLPNIDPLTKKPIENPVRNIHCRHVFDEQSIQNYIRENQGQVKCPLRFCNNSKLMKQTDFAKLSSLTEKVKKKNLRESERVEKGKCNVSLTMN